MVWCQQRRRKKSLKLLWKCRSVQGFSCARLIKVRRRRGKLCVCTYMMVLPSPFTLFMADTLWSEIEVIYPETFHLQRKLLRYEGPADVCNTQYFLWPSFSTLWQSVRWQSKQALFSQDMSKEKCEKILRLLLLHNFLCLRPSVTFLLQVQFDYNQLTLRFLTSTILLSYPRSSTTLPFYGVGKVNLAFERKSNRL